MSSDSSAVEPTASSDTGSVESSDTQFDLHLFRAWLESEGGGLRDSRESATTTAVALSWLTWVHKQPLSSPPLQQQPPVSLIDAHCLRVSNYTSWLATPAMQQRRAATRRAYLFRLKRFLQYRRALLPTLSEAASVNMATSYGVVMDHLSTLISTLTKAAAACQARRFTQDALRARGEWADVAALLRAITANRPRFDLTIQRAAAQGTAQLADRCFCARLLTSALDPYLPRGASFLCSRSFTLQYVLASAYLKVGPARPSFWEGLNLSHWAAAKAHPQLLLESPRFKTSQTYGMSCPLPPPCCSPLLTSRSPPPPRSPPFTGVKALRLNEEFIRLVDDYLRAIRPLCFDESGVFSPPTLQASSPLFVNPRTGQRLTRMSRMLTTFFTKTLGARINATRIRGILFTAVTETCSSEAAEQYAAGDTHRGKKGLGGLCCAHTFPLPSTSTLYPKGSTARRYYLKHRAETVSQRASLVHHEMLAAAAAAAPLPAPAPNVRSCRLGCASLRGVC